MCARYIEKITLPSSDDETEFLWGEKRNIRTSIYPFRIFPELGMETITLEPLTIFYGGNGCGKTTLLNIIAEKCGLSRQSLFYKSQYFEKYVEMTELVIKEKAYDYTIPQGSCILTSDDVFDYMIDTRNINSGNDRRRIEVMNDYVERKYGEENQYRQLKGLDDYDDWLETHKAKTSTQSKYTRQRVRDNIEMHSNGETALRFFTTRIKENALYLLDEPENSLSAEFQTELCSFILDSIRYYGCQFIISTHSPFLLAMKGALIYDLSDAPVITKKWTELSNVRRYYDFFKEHEYEFED